MRKIKLIVAMVLLAGAGLVGYAYLGDLEPADEAMSVPVEVSGDAGTN